jgi:hypothetical protein
MRVPVAAKIAFENAAMNVRTPGSPTPAGAQAPVFQAEAGHPVSGDSRSFSSFNNSSGGT